MEIALACLFLKETSKCWRRLEISVSQGDTASSSERVDSSSPTCSADKQVHPACSVMEKPEGGFVGEC